MIKKREFVLCLPWKIEGDKFYFRADDLNHAMQMVHDWLEDAQDICEHKEFKSGKCEECDWKCDHEEIEDHGCLMCGESVESFDPREDEAYQDFKERDL